MRPARARREEAQGSKKLRERLGLSCFEWARALGVSYRTVMRWENNGADPGGMATEVMRGISAALAEGVDPRHAGRIIGLGLGSALFYALKNPPVTIE